MLYLQQQLETPPLFEAVGCICFCEGRLLLLKRFKDKSYPGYWGIPGGKLDNNESPLRATIRELYEETGILLSSDNLTLLNTYHIVTEDMSFLYTTYLTTFRGMPPVRTKVGEHDEYGWFTIAEALQLQLIPELDSCLYEAQPHLPYNPTQLSFFPEYAAHKKTSVAELERAALTLGPGIPSDFNGHSTKQWYVSYGPPGAGKTTALKAIASRHIRWVFISDTTILSKHSRLHYYLTKVFDDDDHSFLFPFQLEALATRFWQAINAPPCALVDETIFSIRAYSIALYRLGWLSDHEYQTFYVNYLSYLRMMPPPTAVLYFTCGTNSLMKRIKSRGRKHEAHYSLDYVQALRYAFAELAAELTSSYKVITIDTDKLKPKGIADLYGPKDE